jgi:hypothetical protein
MAASRPFGWPGGGAVARCLPPPLLRVTGCWSLHPPPLLLLCDPWLLLPACSL